MKAKSDLATVFMATTYTVFLPQGSLLLRIDQPSPELKAWLAAGKIKDFALLTAHNPDAEACSPDDNAQWQAQLEGELLEGNYEPYATVHRADAGDWPEEEGCFVPELQLADALALAEAYGQLAVVAGGADGTPRLHWTELADEKNGA
ncbi:MAG: DUF3293 domain-containing protein [Azonexus sp.]|nr:DUF3293 domain-containing protein [Azonexus sp.]